MKAFISTIKTPTGAVSFTVCLASFIMLILLLTSCQAQTNAQASNPALTHYQDSISIMYAARFDSLSQAYDRKAQEMLSAQAPAWYQGQETERAKEAATTPQATTKTGLSSDGSTYTTRDGKPHQVQRGPRGGKYYINDSGERRSIPKK